MSCQEMRSMIHGYLDDELGLDGIITFERHVEGCPSCAVELEDFKTLRGKLHNSGLRYKAPPALRARIQQSLSESPEERRSQPAAKPEKLNWRSEPRWAWTAAAFACVVLLLVLASALWRPRQGQNSHETLLAQQVLDSHVRSMMADHLFDVPSSDQHTVKPWFDGKLDFSPPVPNLDVQGFILAGGRLDYLEGRPVAAVVYRRRRHVINLFMWPEALDKPLKTDMRNGYNMLHWSSGGMEYWAVSDLNQAELLEFVNLVERPSAP